MTLQTSSDFDVAGDQALRRRLHAHPEIGFDEHQTSALVAEELRALGVEVHTGIGGTGVVGVIRRGASTRAIGIRADMDALPITESATHDHASQRPGVMHACGHDGHTAILIATARALVRRGRFDGVVYLIFQPAEEGLGGANRMLADGLFERFPMDAVFALHNWPGLAVGKVAIKSGAMMGAVDRFDIAIEGVGAHAAQPDTGTDPVTIAAQLVTMLQTIVSRNCAPTAFAVLSVTAISSGNAYNVIPQRADLRGTVRTVDPTVQARIEGLMRQMVAGVGASMGARCTLDYRRGTPPTLNHERETRLLRDAAVAALGAQNVEEIEFSSLAGEDFACFLQQRPGAFIRLGNGPGADLHSPFYDFCDEALPVGVNLWTSLVERMLPLT